MRKVLLVIYFLALLVSAIGWCVFALELTPG